VAEAKTKISAWLEEKGLGKSKVQYKLRDWLFSRQRYWGEPFPILHLEDGTVVPLPAEELPVTLPEIDEYRPTEEGRPPLARADDDWLMVELPDGRKGVRETNTMPQWAGSCWYYLRYIDPGNEEQPWDLELEKYWLPVDLYIGGVEHAVLHLLYARFWHKVLYDCGLVASKEPFHRLFNQGMILATSYRDKAGKYHLRESLEKREGVFFAPGDDRPVNVQVEKMGKSKLNGIDPMQVIEEYGADAVRLYELFMGPLEQVKPWQMESVEGIHRFLSRVWRLVVDEFSGGLNPRLRDAPSSTEPALEKVLHRTIKKVTEDTAGLRFNTAIAQMMVFVNEATGAKTLPREIISSFLRLLAPYAAHLAEEAWERLGEEGLVCHALWPIWDEALCVDAQITVVVQVNGKLRDRFDVAPGTPKDELERLALASIGVQRTLEGKPPRKVIVIPDRLVNVVA